MPLALMAEVEYDVAVDLLEFFSCSSSPSPTGAALGQRGGRVFISYVGRVYCSFMLFCVQGGVGVRSSMVEVLAVVVAVESLYGKARLLSRHGGSPLGCPGGERVRGVTPEAAALQGVHGGGAGLAGSLWRPPAFRAPRCRCG